MKDLSLVFEEIPKKRIVVIGDIMLDHYFEGRIERVSPEAQIPIVSVDKEWFAPGGAGNTALNVKSLGAKTILIGWTGDDLAGKRVIIELTSGNVCCEAVLLNHSGTTIEKVRILVNGRHIARIDADGSCFESGGEQLYNSINYLKPRLINLDAILISDYAKGFVTEDFAQEILQVAKEEKKMVIVDTKPKHFRWFKGCFCIKPNKIEAEEFSRINIQSLEDAEKAGNYIKKILETNVLLTLGPMGMMLFEFEEDKLTHFSSNAKDVFDVTGAGDTVLATFALALCAGASMRQAADLANHSAAIVIGKPGTSSVSLEELKKSIS